MFIIFTTHIKIGDCEMSWKANYAFAFFVHVHALKLWLNVQKSGKHNSLFPWWLQDSNCPDFFSNSCEAFVHMPSVFLKFP